MAAADAGRKRTPRSASGMSATITSALKITAESTALSGLCSFMMLSELSCGYVATKSAGMMAKYFAIIPALFVATYPQLNALNIMKLHSPESAVLSAVIFNALVIVALIPLALRGVRFRPASAEAILRRNVLIYGVGGIIVPFIFIKLIDLILVALHAY